MQFRRSAMSLLLVFLLIVPIVSFASTTSERDKFVNGSDSVSRMLLEARERELSQAMSHTESLNPPIITKAFIAYDSINNRYLSVYFKRTSQFGEFDVHYFQLFGQMLNHTGEPLAEEFPISSGGFQRASGGYWSYLRADVAFDRINRHFLVVWPDFRTGKGEIFGQFIRCDGSFVNSGEAGDPNFRISTHALGAGVADLAFDPQQKRFLVVWTNYEGQVYYQDDGDICARFVNSSSPLSPLNGSKELIVAPSATQQVSPAVAFDRYNRNFLVAWRDNFDSGSLVKGQLLDEAGNRLGSTDGGFPISGDSLNRGVHPFVQPEVDWEGRTHRFLVVWTQFGADGHPRIHGQVVKPNGTLYRKPGESGNIVIADNTIYQNPPFNINPNVMFDRMSGNFLVAYTNQDAQYGQYVAPDGTLVGTSAQENFFIGNDWRCITFNKPGLAYNSRCGHFMVSWAELEYVAYAIVGNGICADLPVVSTGDMTNITGVSATCHGKVELEGGLDVTARGFCWGTESRPGLDGNHTVAGQGPGNFESTLTPLSPNTTYHVRAYATTSGGTSFGVEKTFTTPGQYVVTFKSQNGGNVTGQLSQTVLFGRSTSPVVASAKQGFFFTGWTGEGGFDPGLANPLIISNVTADMNFIAGFSPINLRGERISASGLKSDIGEIEIICDRLEPSLPLVFKLYRSIDGAGRQLVAQIAVSDLADGYHHILDTRMDSRTGYQYIVEVETTDGSRVGISRPLDL